MKIVSDALMMRKTIKLTEAIPARVHTHVGKIGYEVMQNIPDEICCTFDKSVYLWLKG